MHLFMFACFKLLGWISSNFLKHTTFHLRSDTMSQHKLNGFVVVDIYDHLKITYYSNTHILKFSFLRSL